MKTVPVDTTPRGGAPLGAAGVAPPATASEESPGAEEEEQASDGEEEQASDVVFPMLVPVLGPEGVQSPFMMAIHSGPASENIDDDVMLEYYTTSQVESAGESHSHGFVFNG